MKTAAIFLFLFIFFSCTTDNLGVQKNENTQVSLKNGSQPQLEDLSFGLDRVSYLVGRTLLKHEAAQNQITNLLTRRNTINFAHLIDTRNSNSSFRIAFEHETSIYDSNFFEDGTRCCAGLSGGIKPKPQKISELFSLENFINNNCFELYFPTAFELDSQGLNQEVNITPHPLADNSWPEGFVLWQNPLDEESNEGYYTTFDNSMLNIFNVIVVRPKRNENCQYNYIPVVDFTGYFEVN